LSYLDLYKKGKEIYPILANKSIPKPYRDIMAKMWKFHQMPSSWQKSHQQEHDAEIETMKKVLPKNNVEV